MSLHLTFFSSPLWRINLRDRIWIRGIDSGGYDGPSKRRACELLVEVVQRLEIALGLMHSCRRMSLHIRKGEMLLAFTCTVNLDFRFRRNIWLHFSYFKDLRFLWNAARFPTRDVWIQLATPLPLQEVTRLHTKPHQHMTLYILFR
jgi:hypothetical protein